MSEKHLKLFPHKIRGTDKAWWYEEEKGIAVLVEPTKKTCEFLIPWRAVKYALKRKEQP